MSHASGVTRYKLPFTAPVTMPRNFSRLFDTSPELNLIDQ